MSPVSFFQRMHAAVVAVLFAVTAATAQQGYSQMNHAGSSAAAPDRDHPYVGMWITKDGRIRHSLLPNGRYDEARGRRESAYQGRYEVRGNHIDYWDDTGFTADGEFIDGVLHHAGMILYRDGKMPR
jgi:hypothetical protein